MTNYISKQHVNYTRAIAVGNQHAALDALWRAASYQNLLPEDKQQIEAHEAAGYLQQLGWNS